MIKSPPPQHPVIRDSLHDRLSRLIFLSSACLAIAVFLMATLPAAASDYVLVVDISGSMKEHVSAKDKRVRITVVQDALKEYLPALPRPSRVYLIAFSTGIISEKEMMLQDDQSLTDAMVWVEGLERATKSTGQTHLWTTLRRALQIASRYSGENPTEPVVVRALTDGQDNEKVTSLDKVLAEFPLVDGEHIQGNLVLLGDLQLKTKLSLPEGAFETTPNLRWSDIFPPVVLWLPRDPKTGDEVRFCENTRSIYASYEWRIDGTSVGTEKILTWHFPEARTYRVTLKVRGLQGTPNLSTVLVRVGEKEALTVDFLTSEDTVEPGQDVRFMARGAGQAINLNWFIDSTPAGTGPELTWRSAREGKVEVKLIAKDGDGRTATKTRTLLVKESPLTVRIAAPKEALAGKPLQVASEITGPCASVEWNFGDGTTSVESNPQHVFTCGAAEFKDFPVRLRAVSRSGKVVHAEPVTVHVRAEKKLPPLQAAFRVVGRTFRVGDRVQLVDESLGLVETRQWDVSGELAIKTRNPEILLKAVGNTTVRLSVKGPGGESTAQKEINVEPRLMQPVVRFEASALSGKAPMTVSFTNQTTGDYRSLFWTFGDGQSSVEPNPVHTFARATNYTVTLAVQPKDPNLAPIEKQTIVIVTPSFTPPLVRFDASVVSGKAPLTVQFTNRSTGDCQSLVYNFGDGQSSVEPNPVHTFAQATNYTVALTAWPKELIQAPVTQSIVVTVTPRFATPVVRFDASVLSGKVPLKVQFTNRSMGDYRSLVWDFGDGQESVEPNPIHTFTHATNYVVTLTALPMETTQASVQRKALVKVIKPWPIWSRWLAATLPLLVLGALAAYLILRRRRRALRFSLHYWPEQSAVCRTMVFTRANEARALTPHAPVRVRRMGSTKNLMVEPLNEAVLLSTDGQEVTTQSIGEGGRIVVKTASGSIMAVAISAIQKPQRPSPVSVDAELFSESEAVVTEANQDFDWGWETTNRQD